MGVGEQGLGRRPGLEGHTLAVHWRFWTLLKYCSLGRILPPCPE